MACWHVEKMREERGEQEVIVNIKRSGVRVLTVTGHTNFVSQFTQALHNEIFVLREHLGETVGGQTHVTIVTGETYTGLC